jgi:hypothetical protein
MCVTWLELFWEAQIASTQLWRFQRATAREAKTAERKRHHAELMERKSALARRLLEHEERDGCKPSERERKDLLLQWRRIRNELIARRAGSADS